MFGYHKWLIKLLGLFDSLNLSSKKIYTLMITSTLAINNFYPVLSSSNQNIEISSLLLLSS